MMMMMMIHLLAMWIHRSFYSESNLRRFSFLVRSWEPFKLEKSWGEVDICSLPYGVGGKLI